jgi:hypothetical protein
VRWVPFSTHLPDQFWRGEVVHEPDFSTPVIAVIMVMLCQIAWHVEVLTEDRLYLYHNRSSPYWVGDASPTEKLHPCQTRSMVMLIKFLEPLWKSSWKGISKQDVGVDGWMDVGIVVNGNRWTTQAMPCPLHFYRPTYLILLLCSQNIVDDVYNQCH